MRGQLVLRVAVDHLRGHMSEVGSEALLVGLAGVAALSTNMGHSVDLGGGEPHHDGDEKRC